jgi:hypothetical protein
VADCLTRMIIKAQQNDLIIDLINNLFPKGIAVLQYANDTIICLKGDLDKARNLKLLLSVFEQMLGLEINFEKCEVLTIGGDNTTAVAYADIFTSQISMFPLKYLGVPISARRLRVIDWCKMEKKLEKKLDVWQGNYLSYGGRFVLIYSSLSNTLIYHMSVFMVPKIVIKRMDKMRRKKLAGREPQKEISSC